MKILHVFSYFSPHAGGTADLIYKLSRTQAQRGHEVAVYASDFKREQEYIDSLKGVKVHTFHSWLNLAGAPFTPGLITEARRKLGEFQIIHLHTFRCFQNIVVHYYARKYSIPYVLDTHGSLPRMGKRRLKWLYDVLFGYRLLRDASRCIGETQLGVNEYREWGVSQDRIVLIPPPFPVEDFSQLPPSGNFRRKFGIGEKRIIMFLGRIHWIKGIDFLTEAFHELVQQRNDVILAIVGPDDGYKPALVKLIKALNLSEKVLFTGFLGGEDKLAALVDADIVVQTSRYEQGAWAPIEAVLCNTPIIVSSNSGAGEDVRRMDAGYLVEFGNKKDLAQRIQYVLDNRAEAVIKTKKAKEYIQTNLSMAQKVAEYEQLYAKGIEESKS